MKMYDWTTEYIHSQLENLCHADIVRVALFVMKIEEQNCKLMVNPRLESVIQLAQDWLNGECTPSEYTRVRTELYNETPDFIASGLLILLNESNFRAVKYGAMTIQSCLKQMGSGIVERNDFRLTLIKLEIWGHIQSLDKQPIQVHGKLCVVS